MNGMNNEPLIISDFSAYMKFATFHIRYMKFINDRIHYSLFPLPRGAAIEDYRELPSWGQSLCVFIPPASNPYNLSWAAWSSLEDWCNCE